MNPQNKPLPKAPMRESPLEGVDLTGPRVDEAARKTPVEKEGADYGGEHFDLKPPKKGDQH